MIEGWKQVKLADYYTIHSGLSKPAEEFGFGYPFLSFSDIFWNYFVPEELSQLVNSTKKEQLSCSVKKGDVFLTRTSETIEELGMSCVALKDYPRATFNGFAKRLRPINNKDLDPKFIGFYLRSPQFRAEITAYSTLTTRASLNNGIIERLRINLPQLTIQRKISSILSAYDDLIENNRRRMALLEKAARLLYEEWFVRLRFPGHARTRVTDGVPKGWERAPLGEHLVLNYGKALKSEDRLEGQIPVYGSSGIVGTHEKALSNGPGIILGRKGNVGSVYWSPTSFYAIDTVYFIAPEKSDLYLFHALKQMHFINTDVAVPGLNRDMAYSRPLLLPPKTVLQDFLEVVNPVYKQIVKLEQLNQKLRAARDLLLPRLMNGEVAV